MKAKNTTSTVVEKERIRSEITVQVETFLRSGGKIDKIHASRPDTRVARGSMWGSADPLPGLND